MTVIQKILKAMGFEVSDEQAELIETALDNTQEPQGGKEDNEDIKGGDEDKKKEEDSEVVKALEVKLAALEATLVSQERDKNLDVLLGDSKDKELVKTLLKDSEDFEKDLKGLRETKPYLFNELPVITGSEEQESMDEFEIEYRKEYLS